MLDTIKSWLLEGIDNEIETTYGSWNLDVFLRNGRIIVRMYDWDSRQEASAITESQQILDMTNETELESYLNAVLYYNTNDMHEDD